jgi:proteasome alpha subunit
MMPPYYVAPEQLMQDKAEYAKKGIAKGRSIIAMEYVGGVLLIADNPAASLCKISEIYDRIAFCGAGKYSEFESLRKAGIRHADLKGYMYSRDDVSGRSLARAYSETLGGIFSQEMKPLEVEILVVEVGTASKANEIYRITFDGGIIDERGVAAVGGPSDAILQFFSEREWAHDAPLDTAIALCCDAFTRANAQDVTVDALEIAVLERDQTGRSFRRITNAARNGMDK